MMQKSYLKGQGITWTAGPPKKRREVVRPSEGKLTKEGGVARRLIEDFRNWELSNVMVMVFFT